MSGSPGERLVIDLGGRDRFAPGGAVEVAVGWELPGAPGELVLELVWSTSGRGRTDAAAARRVVIDAGELAGARVVSWPMPAGPLSREGKLVSIRWAFRLSAPGEQRVEAEVTLARPAEAPA